LEKIEEQQKNDIANVEQGEICGLRIDLTNSVAACWCDGCMLVKLYLCMSSLFFLLVYSGMAVQWQRPVEVF